MVRGWGAGIGGGGGGGEKEGGRGRGVRVWGVRGVVTNELIYSRPMYTRAEKRHKA